MVSNDRRNFEYYREAVYERFRRCAQALDDPDDAVIASVARVELPRYVRYWVGLLAEHEPTRGNVSCVFWAVACGSCAV
jgi:hypothetical protein